jgi:hypothetical protein
MWKWLCVFRKENTCNIVIRIFKERKKDNVIEKKKSRTRARDFIHTQARTRPRTASSSPHIRVLFWHFFLIPPDESDSAAYRVGLEFLVMG